MTYSSGGGTKWTLGRFFQAKWDAFMRFLGRNVSDQELYESVIDNTTDRKRSVYDTGVSLKVNTKKMERQITTFRAEVESLRTQMQNAVAEGTKAGLARAQMLDKMLQLKSHQLAQLEAMQAKSISSDDVAAHVEISMGQIEMEKMQATGALAMLAAADIMEVQAEGQERLIGISGQDDASKAVSELTGRAEGRMDSIEARLELSGAMLDNMNTDPEVNFALGQPSAELQALIDAQEAGNMIAPDETAADTATLDLSREE